MAEKKPPQKVLSERALELIMINVLGGREGISLHSPDLHQNCNGVKRCDDKTVLKNHGSAHSIGSDSANLIRQKIDQKLNS